MLSPAIIKSNLKRAELLRKGGNLEQAWSICEQLYRKSPQDHSVLLELARTEEARGKLKRARGLFKELSKKATCYKDVGYLAKHLQFSGFYFSSAKAYLKAIKEYPQELGPYVGIAQLLIFLREYRKAIKFLNIAQNIESQNIEALKLLADANFKSESYLEAADNYKSLIKEEPELKRHKEKRALCLFKMGSMEEACEIVLSFYTLDMGVAENKYQKLDRIGNRFLDLGEVELAKEIFHFVNIEYPLLFTLLGEAECLTGDENWEGAKQTLEKVASVDRNSAGFNYLYAKVLACTGLHEKSLKLVEKCLKKQADNANAKYVKAFALDGLYQFDASEPLLLEVLNDDAGHSDAKKCLAHMYFAQGVWDKGFYYYQFRADEKKQFRNLVQSVPYFRHWDGQRKVKKLMLIDEQGVGDKIRYSLFYSYLRQFIETIYVVTDSRLKSLFEASYPGVEVIPQTGFPPTKAAIERGVQDIFSTADLGCIFAEELAKRTNPSGGKLSVASGYLTSQPNLTKEWSELLEGLEGTINIGVCWRGPVKKAGREDWYTELSNLLGIFEDMEHKVNIVSLQYNMDEGEVSEFRDFGENNSLITDVDMRDDFVGMAGLISSLDLVITPATALAELAGALGVPTYLFATQARRKWNLDGDYMKGFYSSVEILFSRDPWDDVFRAIREKVIQRL